MNTNILPKGIILYRGASKINGKPIVAIAIRNSDNEKTGNMVQIHILSDEMHPMEALKTGADEAICGNCPHRGDGKNNNRSCYVVVGFGPSEIYKAYRRGAYDRRFSWKRFFANKNVRFGAYGDPAAVPLSVWANVTQFCEGWTGYTHQWRNIAKTNAKYFMASCDSESDFIDAKRMGYRTFRVRSANDPILSHEISCPASEEAGKKTTCDNCLLCSGTRKGKFSDKVKDITIIVHGRTGIVKTYEKVTSLTIKNREISLAVA